MKIVHVNNIDIIGNRFNGHDMQIELNKRGIESKQVVVEKYGNNPNTISMFDNQFDPIIRNACSDFESQHSIHALIYPYLWKLMENNEFKSANLIHYHLLHNYFGALPVFPQLVKQKKSVITIHDPWLFTGHCIYPLGCERWRIGCGSCPNLDLTFKMAEDNTSEMWDIKLETFSKLSDNLDIIVASKYMWNMVKESPITSNIQNVHIIPFGIDLSLFTQQRDKNQIRQRLGIPSDNYVICFRADQSAFKGFDTIKAALDSLRPSKKVTLLSVGNKTMLSKYVGKYQIIDFEWITDNELMAEIYCACDVFLMPSTAEAFGLMAIETMASSRPIIVCDGTSLPEVTFAPKCGISVPKHDGKAIATNIERLMKCPEESKERGKLGRDLAEKYYNFDLYIERHIDLYNGILQR